jgi:serine/threonine protein kinase
MELVRGIKITDYCDQAKLSTRDRLDLFIKVCQAVQHAHHKGIIHRDLKPSNVLVTLHDGVPVPKIIDFGIAKAIPQLRDRLTDATVYTELHQLLGTPAYMSPEQAEMSGLDIDTRSDIYSLGVLLYELLTGKTPFDAKELMAAGLDEMRRTIREQEPPRPSTRLSTMAADALTTTANEHHTDAPKLIHLLRGDLDWIAMKCLEKDRARRYETANGLAADVQRYLHDEAVQACPPSARYRFRKFARRNKVPLVTAALIALSLVSGTLISTWQALRAERGSTGADAADHRREANRQSHGHQ